MKLRKQSCAMLLTVGMMALALTACGSNEEANKGTEEATTVVETEETTTVEETEETTTAEETEETTADEASSDATTITEDEAINLVKAEMGEEFSYIPADELEEKDGSQYYVIYVKMLLDEGNMTTTDGSELFDKDAVDFAGEYVLIEEGLEETLVISEDGSFELTTTTADVHQVITGLYKFGITDSASVIELLLYPNKYVTNGVEDTVENVEGKAVIEGDKLTFAMESVDRIFTKK